MCASCPHDRELRIARCGIDVALDSSSRSSEESNMLLELGDITETYRHSLMGTANLATREGSPDP
jgi:hypothetical protein